MNDNNPKQGNKSVPSYIEKTQQKNKKKKVMTIEEYEKFFDEDPMNAGKNSNLPTNPTYPTLPCATNIFAQQHLSDLILNQNPLDEGATRQLEVSELDKQKNNQDESISDYFKPEFKEYGNKIESEYKSKEKGFTPHLR